MSGQIIAGIPTPFRIIIEGEAVGLTDAQIHGVIQHGVSFNAMLASMNRSFTVVVGTANMRPKPE